MLVRHDGRGVLVIGQPSHAWMSGQLARAWGNERFGAVDPYEEVCLAAEQHDVGMASWDVEPQRNPQTGLPRSFLEMALADHIELWTVAPRRLLRQSRYAALLVSLHGTRLYARRDLGALPDSEAALVRQFLERQREFQQELLATLPDDPSTVTRNSRLIGAWDTLSLAICLDYAPYAVTEVPAASEPAIDLALTAGEPGRLTLEPWPLAVPTLEVRCEGQRLTGTYDGDRALRDALAGAPWETLAFELRPR